MSESSEPEHAETEEELGQPKSNNEGGENNPDEVESDSVDSSPDDPNADPNPHGT